MEENRLSKEQPREFAEYMLSSSLTSMRNGLWVTLGLFVTFPLVNYFLFPGRIEQQFFIRFGVILPFIGFSLCVLYLKKLWKRAEFFLTLTNALVACTVFLVGMISSADQPGYSYFFVWTMLVFMGNAAFYRIRFSYFTGISLLLMTAYLLAILLNGSLQYDSFTAVNNLIFVICMASIGLIVSWNIYQLNRDNFIRQQALEQNYNNLLIETKAKDEARENLGHSQQQHLAILNSIPDSIFVVDREMRIVTANPELLRINQTHGLVPEVTGRRIDDIFPFPMEETILKISNVFSSGEVLLSTRHLEYKGKQYITETRMIPMMKGPHVDQVMLIVRDVTREKSYEELKLKNAEQKELLLREIHHRVKNNLAIVISMLSLQSRTNPDPILMGIIQDIELRIRSMALIHEHLYRSETLDRIPLADYLKSLSAVIASTFQRPNIEFVSRLESINSDIEAALPIGLIASELLTNAFKYAFPGTSGGTIIFSLRHLDEDRIEMSVSDDGVGLPAHFSMEEQSTLGMFMVRLLIEQLSGELEITNKKGSTFRIIFNHKPI